MEARAGASPHPPTAYFLARTSTWWPYVESTEERKLRHTVRTTCLGLRDCRGSAALSPRANEEARLSVLLQITLALTHLP